MTTKIKVFLRKLRINKGGYTDVGEYFGTGEPLYEYYYLENDFYTNFKHIRARDREHAKEMIRKAYYGYEVRFYN
jgi:hypothetical protein